MKNKIFLFLALFSLISFAFEYKVSWLGNSFGGGDKWVQNYILGMCVAPDGTVYTASVWDEAGREFGIYRNGDIIGACKETHGWGTVGGFAVAANSKYIFIAHLQGNEGGHLQGKEYPPKGKCWVGVSRYNKDGTLAPFQDGGGRFGAMLILHEVPDEEGDKAQIKGLAVDERFLYISDTYANEIRVYDMETMKFVRSWKANNPHQVALDKKGNIWVIERGQKESKIQRYSPEGKALPQSIKFNSSVVPTALCVDNKGRLLVGDDGKAQQILIYSDLDKKPKLVGTFGEKGGIYGAGGIVSPPRFAGIRGIGVDGKGNIYVGCELPGCGAVLQAFAPNGKLLWELLGLEFVHTADADPTTDGIDVYSATKHYKMDWNKTEPGSEWKWYSLTIDPIRYPKDPRINNLEAPLIRYIKGKKFLIMRGMYENILVMYRFAGEIAVPSVMFSREHLRDKLFADVPQPPKGRWIWRDMNGDGNFQADEFYDADGVEEPGCWAWWVDEEGGVWYGLEDGTIYYFPLLGFDKFGNPIYKRESAKVFHMPSPLNHLLRIEYHPKEDVMYLSGYTVDNPQTGGEWGIVGSEVLRFDGWMKGNRNPSARFKLPYEGEKLFIESFCTAGDYLFAVECFSAKVHIYDKRNGEKVGEITPKESGWVDFPDAIRAIKRKNGEYIVFVEEDWKNKVFIYRLKLP